MLPPTATPPATDSTDRQARRQALLEQIRPAFEQAAQAMADELLDLPDEQLFGPIEFVLRDHGHRLVAAVHQAGLDARKKRATLGPASSATSVAATPSSSTTSAATS